MTTSTSDLDRNAYTNQTEVGGSWGHLYSILKAKKETASFSCSGFFLFNHSPYLLGLVR